MDSHEVIEDVVRSSYGRLIAYLSARSHDVAGAEDALSEAYRIALETWPDKGVPDKPEAWLLTVAKHRLLNESRHRLVQESVLPDLRSAIEDGLTASRLNHFPDERLKLLFICAHPAIDSAIRTPLMLQTVLGLNASRIASAFLVTPATMGQRLARAKNKIRVAGIPFVIPELAELAPRLESVLEAIYAIFGAGWDETIPAESKDGDLVTEAVHLARLVMQLLPGEPEAKGLLALMLHCELRREARRNPEGAFVPLSDQDVELWSEEMIQEAERHLTAAATYQRPGRFQLEAAIQAAHAHRRISGKTNWEAIALLYEGLVQVSPTIGAYVNRAAALAHARTPLLGLMALEEIPPDHVTTYQPYWALTAHLLASLGRIDRATAAYRHAIGLTEAGATRDFLIRKLGCLLNETGPDSKPISATRT